jgi:hypothetical protein
MKATKTILIVMLMSAIALAETVTYDFDRSADFSKFKTYAWAGPGLKDNLNHDRIVRAIDAQLAAKGLVQVDSGANPDVIIVYRASLAKDLHINGFSSGFYRFGWRSGSATATEATTGTLAVEIRDAKSGNVVWFGIASKEVDTEASPDKRDKNIAKTAEKIFRNYPPKAK